MMRHALSIGRHEWSLAMPEWYHRHELDPALIPTRCGVDVYAIVRGKLSTKGRDSLTSLECASSYQGVPRTVKIMQRNELSVV